MSEPSTPPIPEPSPLAPYTPEPLTPAVPEMLLGFIVVATILAGLAVAIVLIVLFIRHRLRRAK